VVEAVTLVMATAEGSTPVVEATPAMNAV